MSIQKVSKILEEFRKLDPEMPMQTALSLVSVYMYQNNTNGLSIKELSQILGVSTAAASRNISKLSKIGAKNQQNGLNLVETTEDPNYRVRKCVRITPNGARIIKALEDITNDD